MNKFAERLKKLRLDKNLSQSKLAEAIGYNRYNICDWECGRSEPSLDAVIAIAKFFNESADYLLGIDDI